MKTKQDVKISVRGDVMTVVLPPEIDHHNALLVRRQADEAICAQQPRVLRIDASGVDFMDSSGLGLLMGRLALMKKLGGRMVLYRPTLGALRMVHLAGMERLIVIEKEDV